jgi:hypothetical protein
MIQYRTRVPPGRPGGFDKAGAGDRLIQSILGFSKTANCSASQRAIQK